MFSNPGAHCSQAFCRQTSKDCCLFVITGVAYREGKIAAAGYRVYLKPTCCSVGLDVQALDCLVCIYCQSQALITWTVHHFLSPERCNMYECACITARSETVEQKPAVPLSPAGAKGTACTVCMNTEEPTRDRHALN